MNYFDDVAAFHDKMGLPVSAESTEPGYGNVRPPQIIDLKEFNYRLAFLFEEIAELIMSHSQENLAKSADALVDIVWVALGTAHYFGIPFDALWREVQRANMEKRPWQEGDPLKPRNAAGLEVVKPEGWRPPDIDGVIRDFQAAHGFRKSPKQEFVLDEGAFGGEPDEYADTRP